MGFGRIFIGSIVLAVVAARRDTGGLVRVFGLRRRPALFAALAAATYQAAFFSAVALTGVAVGSAVALGSAPVFTGLLARLAFGERPERRWAPASLLAVTGVVLILAPWTAGAGAVNPIGIALALASGFTYGVYTVSAKRLLMLGAPTLEMLAATLGGGTLLLLPAVVALGAAGHLRAAPLLSPSGFALLAWLGLVTMVGAYLLFTIGLRRVPASAVGSLALGEPLTASVLGVVVLGERPAATTVTGCALLLAGLVLLSIPWPSMRARARRRRPDSSGAPTGGHLPWSARGR